MCGIYGHVVEIGRAEAHEDALGKAVRALSHRGPDASGTARLANAQGTVECGLAHTRLSILDLTPAGNQPMAQPGYDGGRHVLVFNGEIYNFRAIRQARALGHEFVSDGDTEVVLHALVHWGPAALDKMVGMFALALFDVGTGVLLLARDRLGKKPLYLVDGAAGFAFASEVRALIATGWSALSDDRPARARRLPRARQRARAERAPGRRGVAARGPLATRGAGRQATAHRVLAGARSERPAGCSRRDHERQGS